MEKLVKKFEGDELMDQGALYSAETLLAQLKAEGDPVATLPGFRFAAAIVERFTCEMRLVCSQHAMRAAAAAGIDMGTCKLITRSDALFAVSIVNEEAPEPVNLKELPPGSVAGWPNCFAELGLESAPNYWPTKKEVRDAYRTKAPTLANENGGSNHAIESLLKARDDALELAGDPEA